MTTARRRTAAVRQSTILRCNERPSQRFYVETLGCPKNAVDSDKVVASLARRRARRPPSAPTTPTSSWSTPARSSRRPARSRSTPSWRSSAARKPGAKLVVTGCMAERYGDELAAALPEADAVVGFAGEGSLGRSRCRCGMPPARKPTGVRDLLELPRAAPSAPWAYVKVAEGCDRACAFCAIPSFRGKQRSRTPESIEAEVARPRRRRRRRDRARRAGPRVVRPRRRRARLARAAAAPPRPSSRPTASRASGSSTSTRARCATRSSRRCSSCRPSSRTSTSRSSTPIPRCSARMKRWGSGDTLPRR